MAEAVEREEEEMGEVEGLNGRVDRKPRTPVRRFKCERCGTNFHIKRSVGGHYVRYMPPKYCPGCGEEVG